MTKEYIIYYGTIIIAALLAWLAQKFATDKKGKYKLNKIFFYSSALILSFTMGLRISGVGVDDKTYESIFNSVNNTGLINYFLNTKMEPGYLLLNKLIGLFTDNFQVFLYIVSLIPLIFMYKAFEYERKNINFFLAIFLFGTLMYLYFFGIIRLFIAVSITSYAIRYLFQKNTQKYVIFVLIASMFHFSALFMLLLVYFSTEKEDKPRSVTKFIIGAAIILPMMIIVFSKFIVPFLGESKFESYTELNSSRFGMSIGDLDKLPFLLLALLFKKDVDKLKGNDFRIYIAMFALATIVALCSKIGSSTMVRLQWYFMFSLCIILPSVIRSMIKTKFKYFTVILIPFIIFYGFLYSYRIVFVQKTNECMRDYESIFVKGE